MDSVDRFRFALLGLSPEEARARSVSAPTLSVLQLMSAFARRPAGSELRESSRANQGRLASGRSLRLQVGTRVYRAEAVVGSSNWACSHSAGRRLPATACKAVSESVGRV